MEAQADSASPPAWKGVFAAIGQDLLHDLSTREGRLHVEREGLYAWHDRQAFPLHTVDPEELRDELVEVGGHIEMGKIGGVGEVFVQQGDGAQAGLGLFEEGVDLGALLMDDWASNRLMMICN